jgi:hypothetical protein
MNRTTNRLLALSIAFLAALSLASCANATGWYPSGNASVAGSYEYEDAGVRSLVVTASIENTGTSSISRSTFTITANTAARSYWKTVVSDTRVLPGAKIKVTGVIDYASLGETLIADGLTIGDAFFE